MTLEDVYILAAPLDTWSMDDMERQRRARYQKYNGKLRTKIQLGTCIVISYSSAMSRKATHRVVCSGCTFLWLFAAGSVEEKLLIPQILR